MPAPKTSNPPRRKGPAFKPPRPIKPAAEATNSTKHAAGVVVSRSARATKTAATSRSAFKPAVNLISSSEGEEDEEEEEDEDEDAPSNSDRDEPMDDISDHEDRDRPAASQPSLDPIPPALLQTLLHYGFEDKKMQIQQGAMNLVEKYMHTFVREAIARARFERGDANKGGSILDRQLQVEDLEKLAPQLVLDF